MQEGRIDDQFPNRVDECHVERREPAYAADPLLRLRRVDDKNVALALTGVIKRDSFSVGRPFGRSVATARLGALPDTAPIRVHNINFVVESRAIGREHDF